MFSTKLNRVFTSFIVLGLALVQHGHSHTVVGEHNKEFGFPPRTDPFLPVTDEHQAAWNRVLEECFPLNTRSSLSDNCMSSLGEYFANEPVWSYSEMHIYMGGGWRPLFYGDLSLRRNHSPVDFLNTDVPFWRHIFDDQIEQRQEVFLRVVSDSKCRGIAHPNKDGMHYQLADHCAVREMYKYAGYLNACFDAKNRLTILQSVDPMHLAIQDIISTDSLEDGDLNLFERSFQLLEDWISDESLKSAAKSSMEKNFLHASWVTVQCDRHGFVLRPDTTIGSYTSTAEKLPWSALSLAPGVSIFADEKKYHGVFNHTYELTMKIAMKAGDDWAIRSGYLGSSSIAEYSAELMQRYPLLMHRVIGEPWKTWGYGHLTSKDRARHRAKAYLLLVEEAGEELARSEIDPAELTKEIRYIKRGGKLKAPPTRADIEKRDKKLER